jgi:hypothetical protein
MKQQMLWWEKNYRNKKREKWERRKINKGDEELEREFLDKLKEGDTV